MASAREIMLRDYGLKQRFARQRGASVLPVAIIMLFFLYGCAPQKVVYIPIEKRKPRMAQDSLDNDRISQLKRHYEKWRGTPYVSGGMSASGMDCSGFTLLAFRDVFGLSLPRTAGEQAESGIEVTRSALQPGDLVFFHTGIVKRHVGIYLADDQFIHASLSRGVTVSSLDDPYWHKKYWQARRLSNQLSPGNNREIAKASQ